MLQARVARQPLGLPFVLQSPHGEARVLGTALRLVVDGGEKGSTRLEVTEGRVQFRRTDGKALEVPAGSFVLAGAGAEFLLRPLPNDEILLLPEQARLSGTEWRLVKDAVSVAGVALESPETAYKLKKGDLYESVKNRPAYALFTFPADAGKDYHVWIRGRTPATVDRIHHDEVAIEPGNGILSQRCRQLGWTGTTRSASPATA